MNTINLTTEENRLLANLVNKLNLVLPNCSIYGGGEFRNTANLNWAMQQIRPTGKPAGDRPGFNKMASDLLNQFIPSLPAEEAGILIKEIHVLTHEYVRVLIGHGLDIHHARRMAYGTCVDHHA